MSQARFQKRQREKARQEKAAAKRDRRAARLDAGTTVPGALPQDVESRVLAELGELHREFAEGTLEFDEFEERKRSLLEQLEP